MTGQPQPEPASEPENNLAPTTEEPAGAPEPEGEPQGEPSGEPSPEPELSGAEKRIHDLIAQRNATREYAEYWREQAMAARSGGAPPAPPSSQAPAATQPQDADDPRPKRADFDNEDAYIEAVDTWQDKQIERKLERKERARAAQAEDLQRRATWSARCAEFAKDHEDFYTVIENPKLPFTTTMRDVVTSSELGPAIALHLGRNPAEAARIARLPAAQQAAALGKLEAQLPGQTAARKPSNPPPANPNPPPPSRVSGSAPPSINLETCTLNEYLAHRIPGYKGK